MPLTSTQLEHLDTYGYVVVEGLLDPEEHLGPITAEYHGVLDQLARDLVAAGSIASTYAELPFGPRVARIYAESGAVHHQYFDFSLPQKNIRADTPFWAGPAVFRTLTAPPLLDAVESVIGPDIYSNPVQHVRIKVPERDCPRTETGEVIFGATPWHQDSGVVAEEADDTEMLTVWFPLRDVGVENGCLRVTPSSHRGEVLTHCTGRPGMPVGLQIPGALFDEESARALPMRAGDVLFLHRRTIHAALPNVSDEIRWSLDLRYQPIGQPTGRPTFPGFVARSRANPVSELHDPVAWEESWRATRDRLAAEDDPSYNRWSSDHPACA